MKKSLFTILITLTLQHIYAQQLYDPKLSIKVDSIISNYYKSDQPGLAVAVINEGQIIYNHQIGKANLEYQIPISDSSAFHIASVSKQFTAYLAVLLDKKGLLTLEDDIRIHLPELKSLPYKITIKQLANHTHGLPNLFGLLKLKGKRIDDHTTHKEIVQLLLKIQKTNFIPGEKYEYNNTGYVLLAEIIERKSEKPFQQILEELIFIPNEMYDTRAVNNSTIIIKNKAQSYKNENGLYKKHPFNTMANGSSGISTTISDLSKWATKFQFPDKLSKEIFEEMTKPTILNSDSIINYGLGLEFKKYKGQDIVFHGGGDAGYRSYLLHIPKFKFSVAILGNNNDFTPLFIVNEIIDLYLKDYLENTPTPIKTSYNTKELKQFEGTFEMFPGTYFNIIAENDTLFFQSYGNKNKAPLPTIGDGEFLFPYVPTSKFSFYKGGFIFNIADFKYDCKRVNLPEVKYPNKSDLIPYTGVYHNHEFNLHYEIVILDNQLIAIHQLNGNIPLMDLGNDHFYTNQSFFGKLDFIKNKEGRVNEFLLSGQNLKNLSFKKIN
ncbi:serine hydrolase domain-containing protein [Marinigracilibium pacificum]|uniref:Beta-lactamase family protein n=1 Tax=Marinigracilibium pacificum TaxID=2729599 RepID=A0A848ITK6_9BACT|nr:serine hydrolase domain-containing protein [Marinigracilibium pacificum]NMM47813.1 beta-lactamase family protein [Marinigracilibium pacificum]